MDSHQNKRILALILRLKIEARAHQSDLHYLFGAQDQSITPDLRRRLFYMTHPVGLQSSGHLFAHAGLASEWMESPSSFLNSGFGTVDFWNAVARDLIVNNNMTYSKLFLTETPHTSITAEILTKTLYLLNVS